MAGANLKHFHVVGIFFEMMVEYNLQCPSNDTIQYFLQRLAEVSVAEMSTTRNVEATSRKAVSAPGEEEEEG